MEIGNGQTVVIIVYIRIHTYVCTYVRMYVLACDLVSNTCIHTNVCTYVHMHTLYAVVGVGIYIHMYVGTRTHTIRTYVHAVQVYSTNRTSGMFSGHGMGVAAPGEGEQPLSG